MRQRRGTGTVSATVLTLHHRSMDPWLVEEHAGDLACLGMEVGIGLYHQLAALVPRPPTGVAANRGVAVVVKHLVKTQQTSLQVVEALYDGILGNHGIDKSLNGCIAHLVVLVAR